MATRNPVLYNEGFLGSKSTYDCDKIDKLMEAFDSGNALKSVKRFEKSIYNISDEDVEQIITTGSFEDVTYRVGSLRGYQTFGVSFLLLSRNAILTDAVGLGKTAQVSSMINVLDKAKYDAGKGLFRFIYVTELSLVEQARRELLKFTGKPVITSTGQAKDVEKLIEAWETGTYQGIVCSYSLISSFEFMSFLNDWVSRNGKLDYLYVDESAVLRNKNTSTYKMFVQLRDRLTNYRVLMNATPFEGDIYTLYSQLDFVDPEMLPNKGAFDKMFVHKNNLTGYISGYKNPDVFKRAIRYHIFGQTRKELGVDISKSTFELITYQLTPTQRKLLANTNYPQYVFDNPNWIDEAIVYDEFSVPKAGVVLDILESVRGDKVVIYCKHKEAQANLLELIEQEGYSGIILNGDDNTSAKKTAKVNEFKYEVCDVLITNIQKGLNLEFVNHLIFYTFSSNSGMMNQVEGRIIRSQQIENKHVYLILGKTQEYQVLHKTADNHKHKTKHTKTDVSLLSLFLDNYSEPLKKALDSDDSVTRVTCEVRKENDEYVLKLKE